MPAGDAYKRICEERLKKEKVSTTPSPLPAVTPSAPLPAEKELAQKRFETAKNAWIAAGNRLADLYEEAIALEIPDVAKNWVQHWLRENVVDSLPDIANPAKFLQYLTGLKDSGKQEREIRPTARTPRELIVGYLQEAQNKGTFFKDLINKTYVDDKPKLQPLLDAWDNVGKQALMASDCLTQYENAKAKYEALNPEPEAKPASGYCSIQ